MTTVTQPVRVATGTWTIDTDACTAGFVVSHAGFGRVHGTIPITAAVVVVDSDGRLASVQAAIDVTRIATGNKRRDADLAKPHLLHTAAHPTLTFDGSGDTGTVSGVLTVRGVRVPVELAVSVAAADDGSVFMRATTGFDRRPLRIKAPRLIIGGWIGIELTGVFRRVG